MALPTRCLPRILALGLASTTAALAACFSSDNSNAPSPGLDAGEPDGSLADVASPQDAASSDATTQSDDASTAVGDGGSADAAPSDGGLSDAASGDGGAVADASAAFGAATNGVYAGAASADGSAMLLIDNYPRGYLYSHYEPTSGWSQAALLPFNQNIAEYPQLAIDGHGNAYMVWIASADAGVFVAAFSRYDHPTNAWSQPQVIPAVVDGQEISLAVNSSGEAIVLGGTPGSLSAAHYSGGANGSWTTELIAATGGCQFPAVAINDNGLAAAVYDVQSATVVATRSGGTWTIAGSGFSANAYQVNRAITINAAGDVLAGWEAIPQYAAAAYFTSAVPDGGAPVGPVVLPGSSAGSPFGIGGGQLVAVALSPSGDGTLAHLFNPSTGKNEIDAFVFSKSAKTWGATQVMPGAATIQLITFGGVSTGEIFAGLLNTGSTGSGPAVWSDFAPATGWSATPTALSSNTTLNETAPDLVRLFASPSGAVFAAWDEANAAFAAKIR
jgi:hypothetical protein